MDERCGIMQPLSKEEWKRRRRMKRNFKLGVIGVLALLILILFIYLLKTVISLLFFQDNKISTVTLENGAEVKQLLLTPNPNSRPQMELKKVQGIVIHYVGNSGTTAEANRNYFEGLKDSKETYASSHFIIGLEGEVVQCIPLTEVSYASNKRNLDSISIEFCHEKIDGIPNDKTYESLVEVTVALCKAFELNSADVIRHYDVTQKACPKYYVEDVSAWNSFLEEVDGRLKDM